MATTSASWRTRRLRLRRRRRKKRFNLATTSASWRTSANAVQSTPSALASIWPRRQRRGELPGGQGAGERVEASIWPRRQRRGEHDRLGHVEQRQGASIWPRRQRRGERRGWSGRRAGSRCFNLATTSASWRTVWDGRQYSGRTASIWPRRQRRGERDPSAPNAAWTASLQFGHDVSVVENQLQRGFGRRAERGFNLATTSASWRTYRVRAGFTAARCFNLATTSASWRTPPGTPS